MGKKVQFLAVGDRTIDVSSNGQTLQTRENVLTGAEDWGLLFSYGLRQGNDYLSGGSDGFRIPSSYQKWDGLLSLSVDTGPASRLEFEYLRTEMNGVEMAGIIYDLNNSRNDQFNLRYVIQECPDEPERDRESDVRRSLDAERGLVCNAQCGT